MRVRAYAASPDVAPESALGLNWTPSKGDGDEEEPVQRGRDHCDAKAATGGRSGLRISIESMGSVMRPSMAGARVLAGWRSRTLVASEGLRRRTEAEEAAGRVDAGRIDTP
jgi:hypothetical protein